MEVSRGLNAFIQSWNRSLNILIAPHYAGSAESRRAYRIESPALQQAEGRLAQPEFGGARGQIDR